MCAVQATLFAFVLLTKFTAGQPAATIPTAPSATTAGKQLTWAAILKNTACNTDAGEKYLSSTSEQVMYEEACKKSCEDAAWCRSITFFKSGWCSHYSTECKETKADSDAISIRLSRAATTGKPATTTAATSIRLSRESTKGKPATTTTATDACKSDTDCDHGTYCASQKKCIKYASEHCHTNKCGLGDADCDEDDKQGCGPGLFCGVSNCAKFHTIGAARGIPSGADCCDKLVSVGVSWTKMPRLHCDNNKMTSIEYPTKVAAQNACAVAGTLCSGVYDYLCDGKGAWYLCKSGANVYQKSSLSCAYRKGAQGDPNSTHTHVHASLPSSTKVAATTAAAAATAGPGAGAEPKDYAHTASVTTGPPCTADSECPAGGSEASTAIAPNNASNASISSSNASDASIASNNASDSSNASVESESFSVSALVDMLMGAIIPIGILLGALIPVVCVVCLCCCLVKMSKPKITVLLPDGNTLRIPVNLNGTVRELKVSIAKKIKTFNAGTQELSVVSYGGSKKKQIVPQSISHEELPLHDATMLLAVGMQKNAVVRLSVQTPVVGYNQRCVLPRVKLKKKRSSIFEETF